MNFIMSLPPTMSSSRKGVIALAVVVSTCMFYPQTRTDAGMITGVPRVVDGDTLIVNNQRIRLRAIDAPETAQICQKGAVEQRCGIAAREIIEQWLLESDGIVRCSGEKRDRYGRLVGVCYIGEEDVGRRLVREGFAVAYKRYGNDYVPEEREAREGRRGIWSTEFQMPEDWRRNKRRR